MAVDGSAAKETNAPIVSSNTSLTEVDQESHPGATSNANMSEKATSDDSAAQPTVEEVQKPSINNAAAIPNGGLKAWLQVAGGFMVFFNTWGILNTFGVFQTYYESGQLFTETSSNISWIGAIQAYSVLLGGLFSGPIYDKGYLRVLLTLGGFGVVFGHMMLSLCHTFWQALLAQGFCIGLGAGCLFVPALAVIPQYFNTRIGLAMGIAASGSSFGGIIYPIVFYRLIDQIGFQWSVRVLGFIALATMIVPIVVMQQRVKPPKARAILDMTAFSDLPWIVFVIGCMIGFIGLYVMLFYISYFGQVTRITDASMSFYLVPILNASSMFGRTVPNAVSDKTGPLNLIAPGAMICGLLVLVMMAIKSEASIIVIAILFGFFSGVFIALPPVIFVALTQDKSRIGTRIGMGFAIIGFGTLAGGPGGGAILGQNMSSPNWTGLWTYGGVTSIAAGFIFLALRIWRAGPKLFVKV